MTHPISWRKSRQIIERIIIEGTLILETPASFSNGDTDTVIDIPLLTDPLEGRALLTGASLAGALRNYLREHTLGYEQREFTDKFDRRLTFIDAEGERKPQPLPIVARLFGSLEDDGEQSPLIIDDALGTDDQPSTELRDGVRIDGETRTAFIDEKEKGAKFDLELLEAGTRFDLRFELLICEYGTAPSRDELIVALVTALQGLEEGKIFMGARKRRGYGQVKVNGWRVKSYNLRASYGLLDWVKRGGEKLLDYGAEQLVERGVKSETKIEAALGASASTGILSFFRLQAEFLLDGSMLIRTGGISASDPDMVHLHSARISDDGARHLKPALSGTSVAGALRARALKICHTLDQKDLAKKTINDMWGEDMEELKRRREKGDRNALPFASRVIVRETIIENAQTELVQNRVSIDRFTGGARDTALFNQQPAFGKSDTSVNIDLKLMNPQSHEIGLLLLLLKDLWMGDLPLGGESSVGRGRLQGRNATLALTTGDSIRTWTLSSRRERPYEVEVVGDNRDDLETYVTALNDHLKREA